MEKIFIVGTGTEIGKTFCTKKLLINDLKKGIKAGAIKPIETGYELFGTELKGSDSYSYAEILNENIKEINLYFFKKPFSPHLASQIDKNYVNIQKLKEFIDEKSKKYDKIYIEGAGGLVVPYTLDYYTYFDLLESYKNESEVIVITNNILGTINHTMLTIELLKSKNIKIKSIVYNIMNKKQDTFLTMDNKKVIEKLSRIEVIEF